MTSALWSGLLAGRPCDALEGPRLGSPDFVHWLRSLGRFALFTHGTSRGEVVMVRDATGIDCLYYRDDGSALSVSPRLADLATGEFFSDAFLAGSLLAEYPQGLTPYASVAKVPPGGVVTWRPDEGADVRRWWEFPPTDPGFDRVETAELAAMLRDEVHSAVARSLTDAQGPVAVEHSGGLDSATVAAVATQIAGPLVGYTLRQGEVVGVDMRERPVLQAVEQRFGLEARTNPVDPGAEFDRYAPIGPRPQASWLPRTRLAHLAGAERDGVRTLLSGWGGDQGASFSGAGYLVDQARRLRWKNGWESLTLNADYRRRSRRALIRAEYADAVIAPQAARRSRDRLAAMVAPQLRTHIAASPTPQYLLGADALRRRTWRTGHVNRKVEFYAWDMSGMDLIYAYPMLDRRLVEFVMSIPARRWMVAGRHRGLFRMAMADEVPERVLNRPTKNEPHPDWPGAIRASRDEHRMKLRAAMESERVRHYLPGLSEEGFESLDMPRRRNLLLVAHLLQSPFWTPDD